MASKERRRQQEKRFKQTCRARLASARQEAAELVQLREEARERGLALVTFEIVHDAMPDPLVDALPEQDRAEIDDISSGVLQNPAPYKARLEALVAKHPHIPMLWNWYMASMSRAGKAKRAHELAEEIHRRFPDYLFGIAQWVMILLEQDRIEEATRVLDGRLGLIKWWPERVKYHATEFAAFNSMIGCYLLATRRRSEAERQLELLRDTLPDHHGYQALKDWFVLDSLRMMHEESLVRAGEPIVETRMSLPQRALGIVGKVGKAIGAMRAGTGGE